MRKLEENTKKNLGHNNDIVKRKGSVFYFLKRPFWALLLPDRLTHIDEVLGH